MYDSHDEEWLRKAFAEFDHESNLDIRLAAEYFIDDKFLEHLRGKPLTFADNHVLAEFSMSAYAINSFDILFEASLEGFNIILAHPERYTFVQQDRKESYIAKFIDRGYRLQLNLLSLTGYHGPAARKTAEKLLDEGAYTFVGTDIHSGVYIDAIKGASVSEKVFEKLIALKENNNSLF